MVLTARLFGMPGTVCAPARVLMDSPANATSPAHGAPLPRWRLAKKPVLFAVAAAVTLMLLRRGLKSQTGKTVLGTVAKGAVAGAVRALPRLVVLETARRARGKHRSS